MGKCRTPRPSSWSSGVKPADAWRLISILLLCLLVSACQTIAATGERRLTLIGESQEIAMGEQANEQIEKTMSLYEDDELQAYVDDLGKRIAASTERPELPWAFRILDDDAVNAFALPGGYIYITRGIMAHFENQAQLAGVLGHEIGHVTGKHSVVRLSKSVLAQLGLGVAQVFAPELQGLAPLAGAGLQLLFLRFSRDDEIESDLLGVRYMLNVGENPRELIEVMEMLARVSQAREGGRLPQWASTHPHPENRSQIIADHLQTLDAPKDLPVDREGYLRRLDGMAYGKNPREGIARKNAFYHPDMRFELRFPEGWQIANQRQAVVGVSPRTDAIIQLTLSPHQTAREGLRALFRQQGISGSSAQSVRVNGLPAMTGLFSARTQQGVILGRATFIEHDARLFQILGYTGRQAWQAYGPVMTRSILSFRELTDRQYLDAQPQRLRIAEVDRRETLSQLHERLGVPVALGELALLNQVEPDEVLEPGRLIKLVAGEAIP
jgi:predicted Zn-dependent protease